MTSMVGITTTAASLHLVLLDAAGLEPGGRVFDVGCGTGDTTLGTARRVGRSGLALGVDDSLTMVEQARRRAADAGLAHVGFVHADAQTQRFAPLRFDEIVSSAGWSCSRTRMPGSRTWPARSGPEGASRPSAARSRTASAWS